MAKYIIAHDLGTSGNKATLFSTDGELIKSTHAGYDVKFFNDNWAEQNPLDWWTAICTTTKKLIEGIDVDEIAALSFSGQMMGCVCVDKNGNPLRDAIIWADMRSGRQEQDLSQRISMDEVYHITGHRLSSSYSIEKMMWVKDNEPDIYQKTYKMLNAKDYAVFKLTGEVVTDFSDASGTNAFDINTFTWSEKIIDASGLKRELFPDVKPSIHIAGGITEEASRECGLKKGTPVVIGGGDGVCASVGAGSIAEGETYNCLGSSSWIGTTAKKPLFDEQYVTFNWAHAVPGLVAPMGTMQTAGAAYAWLKSEICKIETYEAEKLDKSAYELINAQIEQSVPGANGLIFLPYLLGERSPRWNPLARGAFVGFKMEHTRADILRSVAEGIGMNLNVILKSLKKNVAIKEMTVIGGMAKGGVIRQILADIYNLPVLSINHLDEASSMGAAVIGGVGVGALEGFNDINKFIKINSEVKPDAKNQVIYNKMQDVFDNAYDSLVDVYKQLSDI